MSTTDATTRPSMAAEDVLADPRPFFRALAVESAREVVQGIADARGHVAQPGAVVLLDRATAAIRALIHELERIDPPPVIAAMSAVQRSVNAAGIAQARKALAATRPMCPGGGATIDEDTVDGSCIATCPVCRQYRPAHHVQGRWWAVDGHRARHDGRCIEDGVCGCGLQDRIDRINAAITEAGHAAEAVRS